MHQQNQKLDGLEILRFLSAVAVLLWHYGIFTFVGAEPVNFVRESQPFYGLLKPFYERGYFAVQYFWCISGFIFFWKYQHELDRPGSGKRFFVLRFSRLYPLHFVTLVYVALVQLWYMAQTGAFFTYVNNTPGQFIQHLLMLGNLNHPHNNSYNGVIWSVSIEVLVYVTFFVLCRYLKHTSAITLVIAAGASYAFIAHFQNNNFLQCVALFYFGGVACFAHRGLVKRKLELVAAVCLLSYYGALTWTRDSWPIDGYLRLVLCIPAVVLAFACLPLPRIFPTRLVEGAGNLTYSIYLLHFPIILTAVTVATYFGVHIDYRSPTTFAAFIAAVLVSATLCYRYFEVLAQRMLRGAFIPRRPDMRDEPASSARA